LRFFIYSRKSKFTGKGESVENQIELCRNHIKRDYPDTRDEEIMVFEDEGFSGKNLDRPQFRAMMLEHKKNPANFIVVYRLDRISRSVSDFSGLMDMFQNTKTNFISINEKFDTSTPMGRAMITIAAVFAQLERETIAERVRDNMIMLARTGRWLGGRTPIGFDSEKAESVDIDGKKRSSYKLIPNKEEAQTIMLIFKLFLEIQSLRGVEKKLFALNITPRSGTFNSTMIKNIITHPVYCIADSVSFNYLAENNCNLCFDESEIKNNHGYSTYNRTKSLNNFGTKRERSDKSDWIISLGKHIGFIKGTDWVKANRIIDEGKPSARSRRVHNPVALLSGILKCGICGYNMRPKTVTYYNDTDKHNTFDYLCELKERSGRSRCNCKNVHGNELDNNICNELFRFGNDSSVIGEQFKRLKNEIDTGVLLDIDKIIDLEKLIIEKEAQIKTLINFIAKSSSIHAVKHTEEKITELDNEISEIKAELKRTKTFSALTDYTQQNFGNTEKAILSLKNDWDTLLIPEKRELLKLILERVVWDEKGEISLFIKGAWYADSKHFSVTV
jgi:site-specific DNA recombinase